jgi:polyhydroxybutyrate depolymerase
VIGNKRIVGATDANGVLLLAPDGIGKSWSFWNENPRDIAFAEAVLEDAAQHWPIDPDRVYVSGFSYGSAMAWALACDSGDKYAGFLGIAGTLSSITRRDCATGPFTLRQVHGAKDTVMRPPWGQNVGTWSKALSLSGCTNSTTTDAGRYRRETWTNCADGHSIQLDTHKGGHWIPKGWLDAQLRDLLIGR